MAVTINGTTGITNTGDYDAEDADKILLGADDDLQIYHDGSNSKIINNTGYLNIRSDSFWVGNNAESEAYISGVADGAVTLSYNGADTCSTSANGLTFPSGKGIDFSATSNSSEATGSGFSELLDDYEEGECTMGFKFSGGDFNGSYAERAGKYTKIGNQVHLDFHMNLSNRGSNTSGYVVIRGLPFTVINNTHFRGSGTVGYFSNADSGVGSIFLFLTHNSTEFEPRIPGSGTVTSIASGDITNSFNMYGSVTYFTS